VLGSEKFKLGPAFTPGQIHRAEVWQPQFMGLYAVFGYSVEKPHEWGFSHDVFDRCTRRERRA
jgi:hypothetical protein